MQKRLIALVALVAYSSLLIKVMVFKNVPLIKFGTLMLNFGGTQEGQANFVPFKTIIPYLLGYKGLIIAGINLLGNIVLLIPIGFIVPFIFPTITWKKALTVAVVSGLLLEGMQVVFKVGIFDIDDVILNAFGVMVGYGIYVVLAGWAQAGEYKKIIAAVVISAALIVGASYALYPSGQPVNPDVRVDYNPSERLEHEDDDGATGGV
jgi:glycopeptide antibiotics resistance protein